VAKSSNAATFSGDAASWRRYEMLQLTSTVSAPTSSAPPGGFTWIDSQIFWFGKWGV
jgi:hypothetical protein